MPTTKPKLTGSEIVQKIFYYALRVLVLFYVLLLFLPAVNPARISENINRNLSLFTSGFFRKILFDGLGRAISKGWISGQAMNIVFVSSMFCSFGAIIAGLGGCMSIGNNKFKFFGNIATFVGGLIGGISIFGIVRARNLMAAVAVQYGDKTKLNPKMTGIYIFAGIAIAIVVLSIICFIITKKPAKDEGFHMEAKFKLFLMFMPFAILVFIFSYLPLWGWRYSFFNYKPGSTLQAKDFVGFYWFTALIKQPQYAKLIGRVMINTLGMSTIGLLTSWLPMVFAIFLAEIKSTRARRLIQTFTTLPNFISWVLVYAVALCIFNTDGFLSSFMVQNGFWDKGKNLLMSDKFTWLKMWAWGTWKGLGWSAIIYISAISGIDQTLYEAATVDGAGRFQKMWHVTLPALVPTYCVLLTLAIAGILSNGMEQYFCFENALNTNSIQVLDLYVYKMGIGSGLIPLSTLVGMLKSIISVVLLFLANSISKLVRGTGVV